MQPCPGAQFNIAPIPGGLDWTFYLNATASQYPDCFGAPPDRRLLAAHAPGKPSAYLTVDLHADTLLPTAHAQVVRATTSRMAIPVTDIDPPTRDGVARRHRVGRPTR